MGYILSINTSYFVLVSFVFLRLNFERMGNRGDDSAISPPIDKICGSDASLHADCYKWKDIRIDIQIEEEDIQPDIPSVEKEHQVQAKVQAVDQQQTVNNTCVPPIVEIDCGSASSGEEEASTLTDYWQRRKRERNQPIQIIELDYEGGTAQTMDTSQSAETVAKSKAHSSSTRQGITRGQRYLIVLVAVLSVVLMVLLGILVGRIVSGNINL